MERELKEISKKRGLLRSQRKKSEFPEIALVGYTNAGKSTLMNRLSGSSTLAENKLFATLDTLSRQVNYGVGDFLLVDTVGFINKLPHDLVNAFRATLEETRYADLLLHVVDASSENRDSQMEVVRDVLAQLGAGGNPILTVLNKCDLCSEAIDNPGAVAISAKTGEGMELLKEAVTQKLSEMRADISVLLPLDSGAIVSRIYATGNVIECEYQENGIAIKASVSLQDASRLRALAIEIYQ